MSASTAHDTQRPVREPRFVPTRWTVVLAAQEKDSPESQQALETLCQTYWYPLYAYVRRQGRSSHDAQDLTQEFFSRLLEKDYLRNVDREKGRFRTFLLVALNRFLANEWHRDHAKKRGGHQTHISFDTVEAETRYQSEPELTAEKIYDRRWALALLDRTMARLRNEFVSSGKTAEFDGLKKFLTADKDQIDSAAVAGELELTEGALRVAIHRIRKRYREIFRDEIAQTVSSKEEIDAEFRHLLSVLS